MPDMIEFQKTSTSLKYRVERAEGKGFEMHQAFFGRDFLCIWQMLCCHRRWQ